MENGENDKGSPCPDFSKRRQEVIPLHWLLSFISSAAPNAPKIEQQLIVDLSAMSDWRILKLAQSFGYSTLVLCVYLIPLARC
jgi:hypothetical protein